MTESSDSAFCNVFFLTVSLRYLLISDSEVSAASRKTANGCRFKEGPLMMAIFEGFSSLEARCSQRNNSTGSVCDPRLESRLKTTQSRNQSVCLENKWVREEMPR